MIRNAAGLLALALLAPLPALGQCPNILLGPVSLPDGWTGVPYAGTVSVTNPPPGTGYTFSVSAGSLPSPLTVTAATGAITGSPAAAGTSVVTIRATDPATGCFGGRTYKVTVQGCPTITVSPTTMPGGTLQPYSLTFGATGGALPLTWSATGLPANLSINPATGEVSGTASATGTTTGIVVTATDANGCKGSTPSMSLSITNTPPTPIASPKEVFDTVGNTWFELSASQSLAAPAFHVAGNLLSNFAVDPDGPSPLTVSGVPACADVTAPYVCATANGGSVTLQANGEFTFTPKAGDTAASDSFGYIVTDGAASVSRTVTINRVGRVWYVKNNAAAGGQGRSGDPFNTLLAAQTASGVGDTIFVHGGDLTTTGQNSGIVLKASQRFLGEAFGLPITGTLNTVVNPILVPASPANRPKLDNTAVGGNTVAITNVTGVEVRGFSLAANTNAVNLTTSAAGTGGATITDNTVTASGAQGIRVSAGGAGGATATIQNNTVTATGNAVDVATTAGATVLDVSGCTVASTGAGGSGIVVNGSVGGTTTITGFANNIVGGNTVGSGILVTSATFDQTPGGGFQTVSGGTTTVGGVGNGVGANGVVLTTVSGDLSFTDLDVYADAGAGLRVTGTGVLNAGAGTGFRVTVGAGVSTLDVSGGPAVDVTSASIGLPLGFLRSLNSTTTGVSLVNAFGGVGLTAFSVSSGQISDPAAASGTAFNVSGGNGNVTLGVPIVNSSGNSVVVTGRTSDTVTFSSTINDTGSGISLTSNTGGTISFTGALTLNTGANAAFTATGGGTVSATATGSTVATTTGTAVNVANTTIGASGLKFQSVSANGAASGIVLNGTGASGGLTVTGTGSAGSGGTIQNTTSHGVSLTNTLSPSFTSLTIQNTAGSGVKGTTVTNFSFVNGSINNSGTGGGVDESNIAFNTTAAGTENNLGGTVTITGNSLTNALYHGVDIYNFAGTISNANVSSNTITSGTTTTASKGSGIRLVAFGSASTVANVTTATIANNVIANFPSGAGIQAQGGNANAAGSAGTFGTPSTANIIAITGNRIAGLNAATQLGTNAIVALVNGKGVGNFDVSSNGTVGSPISNVGGVCISLSAFGQSTVAATVNNNVLSPNNKVASQGIGVGLDQTFAVTDAPNLTVTINNNSISQTDGSGIYALARNSAGTMKAKIQNNTVAAPLTGVRQGIRVDSGSSAATGNTTVCLNISGNTSAGSGGTQGIGIRKQGTAPATFAFGVNGMSATATPGVESFINGLNPAGNGTLLISATSGFTNCSLP